MTNRALITDLPKYPVCTVSELLNGSPSDHSTVLKDPQHSNRRIMKLEHNKREILIVLHPVTNEVFAMDRFCYHDGYPLETGDIEDVAVAEKMDENYNNKKSAEATELNQQRGDGQVIPRQQGALKFNKEEHLRGSAKALQQRNASELVAKKGDTTADTTTTTIPDEILALIKPGKLEVDYEDPAQLHDDEEYLFPIITCTLHNRIFDFRTGDMISRSVVRRPIKTPKGTHDTDEEERILMSESTGCHQRIHPVSIERVVSKSKDGDNVGGEGMIFVHDTFGHSVPMRRPGSKVNMEDRSHLMFLAKKKVLSDKENKAREVAAVASTSS